MRPPLPTLFVALVLGLLSASAVSCGEDEKGLLSAGRAENLKGDLDAIDEAVAAGRCNAVDGRLDSLRAEIEGLPRTTDSALRERLESGLANLETQAPEECRAGGKTETQPETQPETAPEETVPQETAPPETTPQETTPPETTPPQTTPQTTPPEEQAPPEEAVPPVAPGGEEAPSGAADG